MIDYINVILLKWASCGNTLFYGYLQIVFFTKIQNWEYLLCTGCDNWCYPWPTLFFLFFSYSWWYFVHKGLGSRRIRVYLFSFFKVIFYSISLPVPSVMPFLPISVLNIDKQLIFKTQIVPFSQEFLTVPAMVNVSSTKSL